MFAEYLTGSRQDWASVLPSDSQAQTLTRGFCHEQRVSRRRNVWGQERNLKRGGLWAVQLSSLSVAKPNSLSTPILSLPSNSSWQLNLTRTLPEDAILSMPFFRCLCGRIHMVWALWSIEISLGSTKRLPRVQHRIWKSPGAVPRVLLHHG